MNNKHRYELRASVIKHPWRVRINPYTKERESMLAEGRGIWDHELKDWQTTPREKVDVKHAAVRVLNGLPALTTAKVISALRKNNHRIGRWNASSRIRGWGSYSSGAKVELTDDGEISIREVGGNFDKRTPEQIVNIIDGYYKTLTAAGIAVEKSEDGHFLFC